MDPETQTPPCTMCKTGIGKYLRPFGFGSAYKCQDCGWVFTIKDN